jgi:hypothetical protein
VSSIVPPRNWQQTATVFSNLIQRWGMQAQLVRAAGARWVTIAQARFTSTEKSGKLYQPTDRKFAMASAGQTIAPDMQEDHLLTFTQTGDPNALIPDENLKLVIPPERIAPGGILIGWTLWVRK